MFRRVSLDLARAFDKTGTAKLFIKPVYLYQTKSLCTQNHENEIDKHGTPSKGDKDRAMANMEDGFVVKLRGLPWSASEEQVLNFFGGAVNIVPNGVHFTRSRKGRPSGEAFAQLESEEDVEHAVEKHMGHIGSRYIEVFRSTQSEMDLVVKTSGRNITTSVGESVLRLRGLPFDCSKEEIAQFFTGLEIVPNGIKIVEDRHGRPSGEAYVQFANQDCAERALLKHKERIGHRYIEIFKSLGGSMDMGFGYGKGRGGRNLKGYYDDDYEDDMGDGDGGMSGMGGGMGMNRRGNIRQQQRMAMRMGNNNNMGGGNMRNRSGQPGSEYHSKTGHSVHMRGLPFQAQDSDIKEFFSPLCPVNIEFDYHESGQFSGEVDVDFATHKEAVEAMKKHKTNMDHRYIELFLNSMDFNSDANNG